MRRAVSQLRASLRALAFSVWTAALFGVLGLGRALLPAGAAQSWLARLQRIWARGTLRIVGARVCVEGEPPAPPFFLVSNHLSYVDAALLHAFAPCSFVIKAEVARWPVFGRLARATGHVFLQRERRRDLPRAIAALERRLAQGSGIAVFPEATSSAGSCVLPFRSPLLSLPARGGWPVHWAALSYRTLPGGPGADRAVCWWGGMEFLPHFWALLGLRGFEAHLRFGTQPLFGSDAKELARRAQAAIASRLIPVGLEGREPPLRGALERGLAALAEGIELLEKLDDERYARAAAGLGTSGIGPHVRHVLEFFAALLRDLPGGWVDYDRRPRDPRVETNRSAALDALRELARQLARLVEHGADPELYVRQDGADWSRSTLGRELTALHSHAVHHYSLIALLLRASGHEPPAALGVAPATLAYWRGERA
jgi:1-acyl-sn-glycerol-3-phosphate acyltransferase